MVCYCKVKKMKTIIVNAEFLFTADSSKIMDMLGEYNRAVIHINGNSVIVNLDRANFVSVDDEMIEFHFASEGKIYVYKSGKIEYVGPEYGPGTYTIVEGERNDE